MKAELTNRQKFTTNKFTPLLLMMLQLWFFFYVIPGDVANNFFVLFSILGGAITCFLLFWIIDTWFPKSFPIAGLIACVISFFMFGAAFIWKITAFSENELMRNGVVTVAVVIDKTQFFNHKGNRTQNMDVEFVLPTRHKHQSNIILSEREYDNIHEGMEIPIIYSSKYPDVAAIFDK